MKNLSIYIFMAGDNNLDISGQDDINELLEADLSDDIQVVIQFDRRRAMPWEDPKERTTKRFAIQDKKLVVLEDLGETNTGDPAVLKDFISWGLANYPAERNLLIIWNHGGGIKDTEMYKGLEKKVKSSLFVPKAKRTSNPLHVNLDLDMSVVDQVVGVSERMVCTDDTSRDFLDNFELKDALAVDDNPFDIIAFDACLMNMFEIIYQIKDKARFVIGSQEVEPAEGWPYKAVTNFISKNINASPEEISNEIIELYKTSYLDTSKDVTQSAFATNQIEALSEKFNVFSGILYNELSLFKPILFEIFNSVQRFRDKDYIDLYDFINLCKSHIDHKEIKTLGTELLEILDKGIIANSTYGEATKNAYGVSIYFPRSTPDKETFDLYKRLDVNVLYDNWCEFIMKFHQPISIRR